MELKISHGLSLFGGQAPPPVRQGRKYSQIFANTWHVQEKHDNREIGLLSFFEKKISYQPYWMVVIWFKCN